MLGKYKTTKLEKKRFYNAFYTLGGGGRCELGHSSWLTFGLPLKTPADLKHGDTSQNIHSRPLKTTLMK